MTALSPYSIPPLVSCLFLLSLAMVTLVSTARDRLWLLFAGFCLVMAVSSLFGFLVETSGTEGRVIHFIRLEFFFALTALSFANLYGIGMTGFRFGGARTHRRVMGIIVTVVILLWGLTLAMLFLTDWVIADIERLEGHGVKMTYGPAMWVLLGLYFVGTIRNFFFLLQAYRKAGDPIFREFVGLNLLAFHTVFAPAIWLLFVLPVFGLPTQVLAFVAFPVSVMIFYVAIVRFQFARVSELNLSLEHKVEERTAELKRAQVRLAQSERMASLGQLVAGVAHEINNPVGAVKSMASTVSKAAGQLKSEASSNPVDIKRMHKTLDLVENAGKVIGEGTEKITRVVDDLKRFARLDEAALQHVDINAELQDTVGLMRTTLRPGVSIRADLGDVPPVLCYPAKLNQVLLNLILNANEAIVGEGEIVVGTRAHRDVLRISIRDTGKGIPEGNLEKVFEPGFTTKGRGVGTGLGLAICYQIIRDHDGTIQVTSDPGKGTTFTIELPQGGPAKKV